MSADQQIVLANIQKEKALADLELAKLEIRKMEMAQANKNA